MSKPASAVARAITAQGNNKQPSSSDNDRLAKIQAKASEARDLEFEIAALSERMAELKGKLNELYAKTLPDMLEEAGLDHIGLPPKGNIPGYDYEIHPYYSASIAASWPEDKRTAAFDLLKRYKAEDLIKTEVTAKLPKGSLAQAKKLVAAARKLKIATDIKMSVHANTLSAWLREFYSKGKSIPQSDLEKIGGSVGRVVRPKERQQ